MKTLEIESKPKRLVVGFGSPHGDDQAGWKVIAQLMKLEVPSVELRQATVPHDLIDWLDEHDALHIIDGCLTGVCGQSDYQLTLKRFAVLENAIDFEPSLKFTDSMPQSSAKATLERPVQLRSAGSHQIDVFTVLELAACLKRLPRRVVLWAIPGERFDPNIEITASCEGAIACCVEQLSKELMNS